MMPSNAVWPGVSLGSGAQLKVWGFRAVRSDVCWRKQRRSPVPTAQDGSRPNSGGWYTFGWEFLDIRIVTHPTQGTLREWSLDYTSLNSLAARPDSCAAAKCLQRQRYMRLMEQSLNLRREKGRFCFDSHDPLFSPHEWFTSITGINKNQVWRIRISPGI